MSERLARIRAAWNGKRHLRGGWSSFSATYDNALEYTGSRAMAVYHAARFALTGDTGVMKGNTGKRARTMRFEWKPREPEARP